MAAHTSNPHCWVFWWTDCMHNWIVFIRWLCELLWITFTVLYFCCTGALWEHCGFHSHCAVLLLLSLYNSTWYMYKRERGCVCTSAMGHWRQMALLLHNTTLIFQHEIQTNSWVGLCQLLPSSPLVSSSLSQLHYGPWLTSSPTPLGIGGDFTSHTIKPTPIPLSWGLYICCSQTGRGDVWKEWARGAAVGENVFVLDPYLRCILVGEELAERDLGRGWDSWQAHVAQSHCGSVSNNR